MSMLLHADSVADEAATDVLLEDVGRTSVPSGKLGFVQPWCRLSTCSPRHRKYGIQPTSPSVSENFRSGKSFQNCGPNQFHEREDARHRRSPSSSRSAARPARTWGMRDDEPTWVHSTVPFVACGGEQRIPVVGVDARHLECFRILRERHGVAALGRQAAGSPWPPPPRRKGEESRTG